MTAVTVPTAQPVVRHSPTPRDLGRNLLVGRAAITTATRTTGPIVALDPGDGAVTMPPTGTQGGGA